ncbi:hypothetical protein HanRHA438_Chr15g0690791 [Helianthus annuus]|nr:hypothetical protein HanRHA438_Chr15g0690791 [Helianthus annuus]
MILVGLSKTLIGFLSDLIKCKKMGPSRNPTSLLLLHQHQQLMVKQKHQQLLKMRRINRKRKNPQSC